jgi:Stage II sporulation protein E (SpoIIE)
MPRSPFFGLSFLLALVVVAASPLAAEIPAAPAPPNDVLVLDGLGKGAAPIDGPWAFHAGDDPTWASPTLDDSGWTRLNADKALGMKGPDVESGFVWYRRRIAITPAPGASRNVALLLPQSFAGIFQVYWNGVEVGHLGQVLPSIVGIVGGPAHTYGLGAVRSGVLAIRVWIHPPASNTPSIASGFPALPQIGSPQAIAAAKDSLDYQWLRRQQFLYGLASFYTFVALLSLVGWLRDRSQWMLLWMAVFAFTPLAELFFRGLHIPWSAAWQNLAVQTEIQIREASQWFLLLWLLQLHTFKAVFRFTRAFAIFALVFGVVDGMVGFLYPSLLNIRQFEIVDVAATAPLIAAEVIPVILVMIALVRRQRLDSVRWVVAAFAFLSAMIYAVSNISAQGVRFTHWTLAPTINAPIFQLNGSPINLLTITRTLLFLSIVYAVVRYSLAERRRQASLELEIQNTRELQQVLVPEALPTLPGFLLTSAYRPAQEVGGDFFQIIPLPSGGVLIAIGDVSGKGIPAAMMVSLLVGRLQALADTSSSPAEILKGLNRRLYSRSRGGFTTCLILRAHPDGNITIANAGHISPYRNGIEMAIDSGFPLGLVEDTAYYDSSFRLNENEQLALVTDGVVEARGKDGELFGFNRTAAVSVQSAEAIAAAAQQFGQDDDITVLTLARSSADVPAGVLN